MTVQHRHVRMQVQHTFHVRDACGFYDLLSIAWHSGFWIAEAEHASLCDAAIACQEFMNTTPRTIYAEDFNAAFLRACDAFLECNQ